MLALCGLPLRRPLNDTRPMPSPTPAKETNPYAPNAAGTKPATSGETAPSRGSLLVIFLTVFIDLLGFGMVLPLLPIYATGVRGRYQSEGGKLAS